MKFIVNFLRRLDGILDGLEAIPVPKLAMMEPISTSSHLSRSSQFEFGSNHPILV